MTVFHYQKFRKWKKVPKLKVLMAEVRQRTAGRGKRYVNHPLGPGEKTRKKPNEKGDLYFNKRTNDHWSISRHGEQSGGEEWEGT